MRSRAEPGIIVREAGPDDLEPCAAIRPVYTTGAVWQVRRDADTLQAASSSRQAATTYSLPTMRFTLQQARLPQARSLLLPSSTVPLTESWHQASARFVAIQDEQVCGYVLLQTLPDQQQGWIGRLLVDTQARRQGAGRALVRAARNRALARDLAALTAHVPVRNVAGVEFYQRCGFVVCGLIEHFYPTREGALMLSRAL